MTVIGLDDTDSRDRGMCTTYAATKVAERLRRQGASLEGLLLVRLNPAVEYKTRGNAALAIHTDAEPDLALETASKVIDEHAEIDDERTNPGLVVGSDPIPRPVVTFARDAIRRIHDIETATALIEETGMRSAGWKTGRGKIGALAAVGAVEALEEWTYEYIAYREPDRWGTPREVDEESVFAAADRYYPEAWDTVDRGEGEAVCVPNAPGPILYGIRGDDPTAVAGVAAGIESEPIHTQALFETNQGTDAHLEEATVRSVEPDRAYRVTGEVREEPVTKQGGHVFFAIADGGATLRCVAFEPTKRFRDRIRSLREGDEITVAGEVSEATLKVEKFAVRDLVETERVTPTCPSVAPPWRVPGPSRATDVGTVGPTGIRRLAGNSTGTSKWGGMRFHRVPDAISQSR